MQDAKKTRGRKKGTPKTGGRTAGTPNKPNSEAGTFARSIVEDPDYRKKLKQRAIAGKLKPAVEALLWHYAYGKPPQELSLTDGSGNAPGSITVRWVKPGEQRA